MSLTFCPVANVPLAHENVLPQLDLQLFFKIFMNVRYKVAKQNRGSIPLPNRMNSWKSDKIQKIMLQILGTLNRAFEHEIDTKEYFQILAEQFTSHNGSKDCLQRCTSSSDKDPRAEFVEQNKALRRTCKCRQWVKKHLQQSTLLARRKISSKIPFVVDRSWCSLALYTDMDMDAGFRSAKKLVIPSALAKSLVHISIL